MQLKRRRMAHEKMKKGFTMIELIIGISVVMIISGVLASIISVTVNTVHNISIRKKLVMDGSNCANRFQREFKAALDVIVVQDSTVRFTFLKSNAASNDTVDVTYNIANTQITRQLTGIGSQQLLLDNVITDECSFYYYDQNQTITSVPANVWRARLEFTQIYEDQTVTYITDAFPEN